MVFLVIEARCSLENVARLALPPHHTFCVSLSSPDGMETKDTVFISDNEEFDIPNSKGTAHFVMKWPESKKEATINVVSIPKHTRPYIDAEDSETYVPIAAFECRGADITKWFPESGYIVRSTAGPTWTDVDLKEDWNEYCEKGEEPVGISEMESRIVKHKPKK